MLAALAATGKPLICSTGMCSEAEIKSSVDFLKSKGAEFVILHCNSTYPTPFKDVNLAYIKLFARVSRLIISPWVIVRSPALPMDSSTSRIRTTISLNSGGNNDTLW
ncbi:N-acetylneuraminate synthase family protein, partial [Serratia marcescens]|uniref:N-acetylneuraminate synthase family protein n=1 Tax=Serratia marcescens TaxID=615 RepID=UPI00201B8464